MREEEEVEVEGGEENATEEQGCWFWYIYIDTHVGTHTERKILFCRIYPSSGSTSIHSIGGLAEVYRIENRVGSPDIPRPGPCWFDQHLQKNTPRCLDDRQALGFTSVGEEVGEMAGKVIVGGEPQIPSDWVFWWLIFVWSTR